MYRNSLVLTLILAVPGLAKGVGGLSPEIVAFFERQVRPVLVERCGECHGAARQGGHLQLDGRNYILTGGRSGPAVEPGDPAHSLLLSVVRHEHPSLKMPKDGERLPDKDIAALERWIALGAPWPDARHAEVSQLSADDRDHWSFRSVERWTSG